MLLPLFCLIFGTAQANVEFVPAKVLSQAGEPGPLSGLAASQVHDGILYAVKLTEEDTCVIAFWTENGNIAGKFCSHLILNRDWRDIAVGPCGQGRNDKCIYLADIGSRPYSREPLAVYKCREPRYLEDSILIVEDLLSFSWNQTDAEGLAVDPDGEVYVISKVEDGNGFIAKLPSSYWGNVVPEAVPAANIQRLSTYGSSDDPRGADLSPDGRNLLVKTASTIFFLRFSENRNYIGELGNNSVTRLIVGPYSQQDDDNFVAWNRNGTGFYTLPQSSNFFHFFGVIITQG